MKRLSVLTVLGIALILSASIGTSASTSTSTHHQVSSATLTGRLACCGGDPDGGPPGPYYAPASASTLHNVSSATLITPVACCGGDPDGGPPGPYYAPPQGLTPTGRPLILLGRFPARRGGK